MTDAPVGRRIVLGMLGLGVAGVAFGARATDGISALMAPIELHDPTGLSGLIPAAGGWRYYSVAGSEPLRTQQDYRLTIDGLVSRPRTYTYAELRAMPRTHLTRDFQCVTGWRVPDVRWKGVRLADVIDRAAPQGTVTAVAFESFDGAYTETLTMEQARRDDVIVAYELDGKPISSAHGGPVRLYVAPMYGYKSLKWLQRITLVAAPRPGYWEQQGYDADAWIGRSNGRSDEPA
jgi:DMSO/TMAO reductase YedYZ molybdopterin-dependent catalytic subunit